MGTIQGDVTGLRGELGEIRDLLRSLVRPALGDTHSRVINTEARQETEIGEEMRRRVRTLVDLGFEWRRISNAVSARRPSCEKFIRGTFGSSKVQRQHSDAHS